MAAGVCHPGCCMPLIERWGRHDAIVLNAGGDAVLARPGPDGWTLPRVTSDDAHPADVTPLVAGLRAQLGSQATVLRCVRTQPMPGENITYRWHEVELHTLGLVPPAGWSWVTRAELPSTHWNDPSLTALLRECLAGRDESGSDRVDGRDWERLGWWSEASAWVRAQLIALGTHDEPTIEQIRCWEFSCVVRVRTSAAEWYFKALPTSYAGEPRLTRLLAEDEPRLIPEVVAVEPVRRWMLMRACAGAVLEGVVAPGGWHRAAAGYARLQINWQTRTDELRGVGCGVRTLEQLGRQATALLADTNALLVGQPEGLTADEATQLDDLAGRVPLLCEALAELDLPLSIDHGDLWPSNVFVRRRECRIIDWTDASIAHPFLSLLPLQVGLHFDPRRVRVPGAAERLRDAYLQPWTAVRPLPQLVDAFELSRPLAALHYAVKGAELPPHDQWWLHRMAPWFVRMALGGG
jgi:hypothetical protein